MDLGLPRRVEEELLDGLAPEDPRARRSRHDLQRVHRVMATLPILQRCLDRATSHAPPRTLLELGAGDGSLMLRFARQRARQWPGLEVTLVDRLDLVTPDTLEGLRAAGWHARAVAMDVFDYLAATDGERCDVVMAHLFIHHFTAEEITRMMCAIASRARVFLCCEPRRSAFALAGSHLIGALGVGPVTRRDAVSSVHAGFRRSELTRLWPERPSWVLREFSAGLLSHCFLAVRAPS
jgi:hypothetical protein